MSLPSLAQVTGAEIHYHPRVFGLWKNDALATAALLGVTLLVCGILGHLNVLHGSSAQIYSLIAVGGGIIVADIIAVTVMAIYHQKAMKFMTDYVEEAKSDPWWPAQFQNFLNTQQGQFVLDITFEAHQDKTIGFLALNNNGKKEIHLFTSRKQSSKYNEFLTKSKNFQLVPGKGYM